MKGAGFVPIWNSSNPFTGTFDGGGHKITNLYINRPSTDFVGLFGTIASGSEIKDVGLEDVDIKGNERIGGLVSQNRGNITNTYSTGSISGNEDVGGLVGENYGMVTNSYSNSNVSGDGYYDFVGGLVGYDGGGTITQSYSTGSVNGGSSGLYVGGLAGCVDDGTVSDSYTGSVSGYDYVGGLIGYVNPWATVTNTYSTGSVCGTLSLTGGLIGLSHNNS